MDASDNRPERLPLRRIVLGLLVLTLLIGGGFGLYMLTFGRPPLVGKQHADVGYVWLDVDEQSGALYGTASHRYRLTNRTSRSLHLTAVRSSCGCTVPSLDVDTVEPGEQIEVAAEVYLDRPGRRTAEVFLHFEDGNVQTLTLEAIGRSRSPLRIAPHRVFVPRSRARIVRIIAEAWDGDDHQPQLVITPPPGIEAELTNWSLRQTANPRMHTPAEWAGVIHISRIDEAAVPDDAEIVIVLDEEHTLRVPLVTPARPTSE